MFSVYAREYLANITLPKSVANQLGTIFILNSYVLIFCPMVIVSRTIFQDLTAGSSRAHA